MTLKNGTQETIDFFSKSQQLTTIFQRLLFAAIGNQQLTKEVQDLKQINQSLMLKIKKLLNEQNPQKQQNQQISQQEMERSITKSNGIQDESLTRGSIYLSKFNITNDQIQNQEEGRIRPSSIRKQKKDVDTVKNIEISNQCYRFKGKQYYETKREFKIYLKSIAQQTKDSIKKTFQPYSEVANITYALRQIERQQDMISKHCQEDKINNLQEFTIRKNQMNMISKIPDKNKHLQNSNSVIKQKR